MAIQLEFSSVIIPIFNIQRCRSLGGFRKYLEGLGMLVGDIYWYDEFLFRDGAMHYAEIAQIVNAWEAQGLRGLVQRNGREEWGDVCVVDYRDGLTRPCPWLEYDAEHHCVYMTGTPMGAIVGPWKRAAAVGVRIDG